MSSNVVSTPGSVSQEIKVLNRQIGYDLLGPIIHGWLLSLHQYIVYLDNDETRFLYCARAGWRIRKLREIFLEGLGLKPGVNEDMLWVSRLSVAKGGYVRAPAMVVDLLATEYYHLPMRVLIEGVLRHQPQLLATFNLSHKENDLPGRNFGEWLKGQSASAVRLRGIFREAGCALDQYMTDVLSGAKRGVLIDSGWRGTTQSLLNVACPDIRWRGLYFGSILPDQTAVIARDRIGLMFESAVYDPKRPETAFIRHRHLIETLLEPNGPSVEDIPGGIFKSGADALIRLNQEEVIDKVHDTLYLSVIDYLRDHPGLGLQQISANARKAMEALERILVHPTAAEARALHLRDRGADFGSPLIMPVLYYGAETDPKNADERIARALWKEGQIALEYSGAFAHDMQSRQAMSGNGHNSNAWPSDSLLPEASSCSSADLPDLPCVAVITRTLNRPLLLKRAACSVAAQTYPNFIWVVVNDGGDPEIVDRVIENSPVDRRRIVRIDNPLSRGMEAASNAGIRSVESDYIVIHDDDDSWHPDFLRRTIDFLHGPRGRPYGGVITQSLYISEIIKDGRVTELERKPFMEDIRRIELAEMAGGNLFAPIAFVYKRSLWDEIGGYNETLPVLGDWYFNLEFLLRADIGVITEPLAYYHHRDQGGAHAGGAYANSVIGGISKHEEFYAIACNEFVRRNAVKYPAAISVLFRGALRGSQAGGGGIQVVRNQMTYEREDRLWVIAQLNLLAAQRLRNPLTRLKSVGLPIDPGRPWAEIEDLLMKLAPVIPPAPNFDEGRYLLNNPDVAQGVARKELPNGYFHYMVHGYKENRQRPTK